MVLGHTIRTKWITIGRNYLPIPISQADIFVLQEYVHDFSVTPLRGVPNEGHTPLQQRGVPLVVPLGPNSIGKFWLEFRLEKPLALWLEIPYTKTMFKNG